MSSDASVEDTGFEPITYFVRIRGKIHGPFDAEKLKKLHARGQFSRAHEVSRDKRSWQPAGTLPELFGAPELRLPQAGDNVFLPEIEEPADSYQQPSAPPGTAKWYYSVGDERHGPVPLMDLQQLVLNGQVSPHDLVWKEGLEDWVPVASQPEFQAQIGGGGNRFQQYAPAMQGMAGAAPPPHPDEWPGGGERHAGSDWTVSGSLYFVCAHSPNGGDGHRQRGPGIRWALSRSEQYLRDHLWSGRDERHRPRSRVRDRLGPGSRRPDHGFDRRARLVVLVTLLAARADVPFCLARPPTFCIGCEPSERERRTLNR